MSELKFEYNCRQFEMEDTEKLFDELSLQEDEKDEMSESFMSGIAKLCDEEPSPKQQQEQHMELVQRRQSIVYANAQKRVTVLANLLKNGDSGWHKQLNRGAAFQQHMAPQAYRFKDIYEQKKQELLRQRLEEERAQREFHSRPMPNFNQAHQQLANKPVVHRITFAVTPNVLKTSRNMQLKRRQKIELELKQREQEQLQLQQLRPKTKPVPKFRTAPLKPSNGQSSQLRLQVKPFRLSTELRAEQRKIFNAQSLQMQEMRRRELEDQRQRVDQEKYQKQRQLATFRARPNPFKSQFEAAAQP